MLIIKNKKNPVDYDDIKDEKKINMFDIKVLLRWI